jgi:hypothetical protein
VRAWFNEGDDWDDPANLHALPPPAAKLQASLAQKPQMALAQKPQMSRRRKVALEDLEFVEGVPDIADIADIEVIGEIPFGK